MPSSWTQNYYHVVFGTKHREPLISDELRERLIRFIGGIARDLRCSLLECNGMSEHIHLLVRFPPDVAPSVMVGNIKSRSSRWMRRELGKAKFTWQRGYGGFTVSRSAMEDVAEYIRRQQSHHRKMTFEQEFVRLLDKHGIEYDPRFLFD